MSFRTFLARSIEPWFDDPRTTDDNGIRIITPREIAFDKVDRILDALMEPTANITEFIRDDLGRSQFRMMWQMALKNIKDGK